MAGKFKILMKGTPVTTISKDHKVVTLINIFTVEPKNQQRLVDMLVAATEQTMRHVPGFVAANIHKSFDGERVANYAQWRSREDFEAMLKNPAALAHMKPIMEIAKVDAHLYEVMETIAV
jgi:heme-degrading monooxygenase HmoA